MKKLTGKILRFIGYLVGFSVLLYPAVSDYMNQLHSTSAITSYEAQIQGISEEEESRIISEALEYNRSLTGENEITDPFSAEQQGQEDERYESILNLNGTGMMGYVEIPKLNVNLPVYHGTSEAVLQVGAGHLENTSFPVGGESCHAVLSGHRGLPSARLFTELDELRTGDIFYIKILRKTFAYQVDQILTVEPHETGALKIESGKNYVTLVTCTPYAVNTHRLLVRGVGIPFEEAAEIEKVTKPRIVLSLYTKALLAGLSILLVIWIGKKMIGRRRK